MRHLCSTVSFETPQCLTSTFLLASAPMGVAVVYRSGNAQGVPRLRELGESLYQPEPEEAMVCAH